MLDYKMPVLLPLYLCRSNIFPNFVTDLKKLRAKNIIIAVDYDFNDETPMHHFSRIRALKARFKDVAKNNSVKFRYVTNLLMENINYNPLDILAIAPKKNNLFFITMPFCVNTEIAMKNIFVIKNLGYCPVIVNFESVAALYPQSFCKALLTTENMYFCFSSNSLENAKIDDYIKTALVSGNAVFFLCPHYTSMLYYKSVERYTRLLPKKHKLNFAASVEAANKIIFK